jgi:hypothetical protein
MQDEVERDKLRSAMSAVMDPGFSPMASPGMTSSGIEVVPDRLVLSDRMADQLDGKPARI